MTAGLPFKRRSDRAPPTTKPVIVGLQHEKKMHAPITYTVIGTKREFVFTINELRNYILTANF